MRDSLGLALSSLFVLFGVLAFARARSPTLGMLWPSVFFALCGVVFAMNMIRRRREHQNTSVGTVSIVGGVRIPINSSRMLAFAVAAGGLGGLIVAAEPPGLILRLCAYLMAAGGVAAMVALAAGRSRTWLLFETDGLRVSFRQFSFLVRWDDVASVSQGEIYRNPYVAIRLRDSTRLVDESTDPRRATKMLRQNQGWYRCDVWLTPAMYGLDAVLFVKAIQRYASEPDSRAELAPRPALPA